MMFIPDYLVLDELKRRDEAERDGGLQPLYLPLYEPELREEPSLEERSEERDRGVVIIDMNSFDEVDE